jgi:crotonobetainyl-CoA:carnitine CoA-transferase CaiB-like acyl-CoA transferase
MTGALDGIRILDLSRLLPGPYCTQLLGDLGAEVIKIEEPKKGDYARFNNENIAGHGAMFLMVNRNKKSVSLNLKNPEAVRIFHKLAKTADVVLEGFRPGVVERLGIDYQTISKYNPGIVYCSLTGYGQEGPYKDLPGHDVNYLGFAGATSLTGERGEKPTVVGLQIADLGGGALMAAFGITAALIARQKTGKGQFVDVSMLDGAASLASPMFGSLFATGKNPKAGEQRLNGGWPCYGIYETKDGKYVTLGALEDKFWKNFCRLTGREDLADDEWKTDPSVRDEVEKELEKMFLSRNQDEWLNLLKEEDVCFGPVNSIEEACNDPQLKARNMFCEIDHPEAGTIKQVSHPIKFSETPARVAAPPPLLGQHTHELLCELGYSDEDISALETEGAI